MSDVSSNFGAVFLSEQKRDLAILFAAIWLFYAKKLGYSVTLDPRGWHFFRVGFLVGVLVKVGFVVGLCVATQQLRSRETAQLCKRVASFSQVLSSCYPCLFAPIALFSANLRYISIKPPFLTKILTHFLYF